MVFTDRFHLVNAIGGEIIKFRIRNQTKMSKVVHIPKPRVVPQRKLEPQKLQMDYDNGDIWQCEMCTFMNEANNLNCLICQNKR